MRNVRARLGPVILYPLSVLKNQLCAGVSVCWAWLGKFAGVVAAAAFITTTASPI